jgi:hypothetical protein
MTDEKIEIVVVTHTTPNDGGFELKCFIDCMRSQNSDNWKLHIVHDGKGDLFNATKKDLEKNSYLDHPNIVLSATEERNGRWGHASREYGLKNRISDANYILITNSDNYYVPRLIKIVTEYLSENPVDFLYWNAIHNRRRKRSKRRWRHLYKCMNSSLKYREIDMGCALIKSSIAEDVGFPYRDYGGDWQFFKACLAKCNKEKVHKIDRYLFVHN